jgi:hypothetical protein
MVKIRFSVENLILAGLRIRVQVNTKVCLLGKKYNVVFTGFLQVGGINEPFGPFGQRELVTETYNYFLADS